MAQKIIKIGSSAGITIPKGQLEELGLTVGDEITVDIKPADDTIRQFSGELDKFMDIHEQDLKNLARK